jgi:hypothetical protein
VTQQLLGLLQQLECQTTLPQLLASLQVLLLPALLASLQVLLLPAPLLLLPVVVLAAVCSSAHAEQEVPPLAKR